MAAYFIEDLLKEVRKCDYSYLEHYILEVGDEIQFNAHPDVKVVAEQDSYGDILFLLKKKHSILNVWDYWSTCRKKRWMTTSRYHRCTARGILNITSCLLDGNGITEISLGSY